LCARRTTHDSESDDRRRRGRESETGWQSSDKYDGKMQNIAECGICGVGLGLGLELE